MPGVPVNDLTFVRLQKQVWGFASTGQSGEFSGAELQRFLRLNSVTSCEVFGEPSGSRSFWIADFFVRLGEAFCCFCCTGRFPFAFALRHTFRLSLMCQSEDSQSQARQFAQRMSYVLAASVAVLMLTTLFNLHVFELSDGPVRIRGC